MKSILYARNPETIEIAYHILTEGGYLYYKNPHTNFYKNNNNEKKYNDKFQNYNNQNNYQNHTNFRKQNFIPRPYYNNNNDRSNNNNFQQRPNYQNNYRNNKPEPMDIDPGSSQIRRNYYAQERSVENFPIPASEQTSSINYHM